MWEIRTHFSGWGVFHPDYLEGNVPVFTVYRQDRNSIGIHDCIAFVKQQSDPQWPWSILDSIPKKGE